MNRILQTTSLGTMTNPYSDSPTHFGQIKSRPKIFGIGTLRTGTTSLGSALEILGYNHTHKNREKLLRHVKENQLGRVYQWVDQHDSFEDWPWPLIYRELDARYPGSRFILTVRESEVDWLRSIVRYSEWIGPTRGREMFFGYGMPTGHESEYLARYREHNQQVRDHFRGRPDQLLQVCWGKGDGWEQLCNYLDLPIPDAPFPKRNVGTDPIRK